jgi:molybdopterin molybdotransferase
MTMQTNIEYKEARELLLGRVTPVETERVPLGTERLVGRVLAEDVTAAEDVPPFDRSPYDGYAFRAADTAGADKEHPVTLRILEEIPAGSVWTQTVVPGTAAKILTGAPVPPGADAVTKYEETEFTAETVTVSAAFSSGENIVPRGEDVTTGDLLAAKGTVIDPALLGVLAAQHIAEPQVYRTPTVAVITTGSELADIRETLHGGKIVNTNIYTFRAEAERCGCRCVSGTVSDDPDAIAAAIRAALETADMVITTGGVSVGDYDYTPDAMERAGAEILVRTLRLKPGGASAYAVKDGKLICGLSGNPASALTNYYAVVLPALRKLCGFAKPRLTELTVTLAEDFGKKSPKTRLIRGTLDLADGTAKMHVSHAQGNGVLHSLVGCDLLAEIPAGSGRLPAGTKLSAYLIP